MRWACRAVWGCCGLFPLLAATSSAAAEPPTMSYSLSWVRAEGAEDCPAGRAMAIEVERRLGRAVFDAAAARSFEVEVARVGRTYHSAVYVRDEGGRTIGRRSLQSDETGCAGLFGATALAIALVIDPEAAARDPVDAGAVAAFEPLPLPAQPEAKAVAAPRLAAPAVPSAPRKQPSSSSPPHGSQRVAEMSVRGQLSAAVVPGTSPGFGLAFSARPSERWGFALTGSYSLPGSVAKGVGNFEVGLTRAGAALTLNAVRAQRLRLVFSLGPSLGAFHVAVREPAPIDPGDFLFAAVELGSALQLSVTNGIFIELGGAALVPLLRQEFLARGQAEAVWSQPWLSGLMLLGVGASFP